VAAEPVYDGAGSVIKDGIATLTLSFAFLLDNLSPFLQMYIMQKREDHLKCKMNL